MAFHVRTDDGNTGLLHITVATCFLFSKCVPATCIVEGHQAALEREKGWIWTCPA